MKKMLRILASVCLLTAISAHAALSQQSDQPGESEKGGDSATESHIRITLGRKGKVTLHSPAQWKQRKPRFAMIDYEFVAPEVTPGQGDARGCSTTTRHDRPGVNSWRNPPPFLVRRQGNVFSDSWRPVLASLGTLC